MKLKKAEKIERLCEYPGCTEIAEYRAPKSREKIGDYYWFCLTHIRDYNKKWNYYEGLSEEEVEMHLRHDSTWQRPSWPFGSQSKAEKRTRQKVYDYFFKSKSGEREAQFSENLMHADLTFPQKKAFELLEVTPLMSFGDIKKKYRSLVKEHHPDRHEGDPKKVELLKKINLAFAIIKSYLEEIENEMNE